jgi:thiol-disulfide isomerase/thioredoxin
MARRLIASTLCFLALTSVVCSKQETADDKSILSELKKLQESSDKERESGADPKALLQKLEANAAAADKLVQLSEKAFATSPLRTEILSRGVRLLDESPGTQKIDRVVEMARTLRAAAEAGSDYAAQADLILLNHQIGVALKDAQTAEQFRTVWTKNGRRLHDSIAAYLKAYPRYKEGLDNLGELATIASTAGAEATRMLILESVAKNFPDHSLTKEYNREKAVGSEIELSFTPVGGTKETSLKDLRGKVVVIDFWATWCGPCKKEMPNLKKLYERHGKEGLEIIGISLDDDEKTVVGFIKDNTLAWPQIAGKTAVEFADKWGIEAIPAVFVIDRKGKLRSVNALGKLEEMIPKLLADK